MKSATYSTTEGPLTVEYDPAAPCVISANGRRRYPRQQAAPFKADTWRTVWEIVAGVVVLSAWGFILFFWLLVGTVAQP